MTELPPPRDLEAPVPRLVMELAGHLGEPRVVSVCVELLQGADREDHVAVLPYLTGLTFEAGSPRRDPASWADYWVRSWGARALLHVWDESASAAVLAGLADEHWRPAEMCLKVATRRGVGGAGDGAASLSGHELPRVRAQAVRTLGVVGDTEHLDAVRARLDDESEVVRRQAGRALERLAVRLDLVDEQ
ncbi:MAG: HEAT repeat domain-containing protein [Nocardioides sp.]